MMWTYNQGIILLGLSKLYKHTSNIYLLLIAAMNLIHSVITSPMVPSSNDILVESRDLSGTCDQDQ